MNDGERNKYVPLISGLGRHLFITLIIYSSYTILIIKKTTMKFVQINKTTSKMKENKESSTTLLSYRTYLDKLGASLKPFVGGNKYKGKNLMEEKIVHDQRQTIAPKMLSKTIKCETINIPIKQ